MKTKLIREEAEEKIRGFFKNIKNKKPEEVRKIKRLAMHYRIKLKEERKRFCKFCYSPNLKVKRIKKGMKTVVCEGCGRISRWKVR